MSEATDRINALQKMIQAGQDPSMEEMAAAIHALRVERGVAGDTKVTKAKEKAEIEAIDLVALFGPKGDAA